MKPVYSLRHVAGPHSERQFSANDTAATSFVTPSKGVDAFFVVPATFVLCEEIACGDMEFSSHNDDQEQKMRSGTISS